MDRLQNRPEEMQVDIPVVPRGKPIKGPLTSLNSRLSRWAMYLACVSEIRFTVSRIPGLSVLMHSMLWRPQG